MGHLCAASEEANVEERKDWRRRDERAEKAELDGGEMEEPDYEPAIQAHSRAGAQNPGHLDAKTRESQSVTHNTDGAADQDPGHHHRHEHTNHGDRQIQQTIEATRVPTISNEDASTQSSPAPVSLHWRSVRRAREGAQGSIQQVGSGRADGQRERRTGEAARDHIQHPIRDDFLFQGTKDWQLDTARANT